MLCPVQSTLLYGLSSYLLLLPAPLPEVVSLAHEDDLLPHLHVLVQGLADYAVVWAVEILKPVGEDGVDREN